MKKVFLSFLILVSGAFICQSCNLISSAGFNSKGLPTPDSANTSAGAEDKVDHSGWDQLLKKHVDGDGMVDYKGFQKDRPALDKYLKMLSSMQPDDTWNRDQLLAYYINLYNAYTVDLILRNYPTKSIKDISGAWTKEFVKIGNKEISLGAIENSLLRKMDEPRIHFAINCASISCPKLINEAYTSENIEKQLEKATNEFINSDKNEISASILKLSSIFDWYKNDFTENGSLIEYINQYSEVKINSNAQVDYKNYDWNLNEAK